MSSSLRPHSLCGPPNLYEETTWLRLVECHGYERAKAIVEGRDEATNADQAAWRRLGGRTGGRGQ